MLDIQNQQDNRNINIQRVGVKRVYLPLQILEKTGTYQTVTAEISLCADLAKDLRGTHMSRFMEILHRWSKEKISSREIKIILQEVLNKLNADRSEISIKFRYFIEKPAPKSQIKGLLDYICEFKGLYDSNSFCFILGVEVPVTTVCPCSKEISDYGAHNQRAIVRVNIEYLPDEFIWLEDLISDIEKTGSSELFPILKRNDEKYVTENAYENPKFVEDVVRDIVIILRQDKKLCRFKVECEASESIHNHNAFACHREEVKEKIRKVVVKYATSEHLDQIKVIADKNRDSLGFIIRSAVVKAIDNKEVFVALYNDNVVGFLIFHLRKDQQATLYDICISKNFRGRSVGKKLAKRLIVEAKKHNKLYIQLKCPENLPSNEFYKALNFELVGKETGKKRNLNIWKLSI
ncbi:MAG: GTP cyclohydrolase FolE2 [bacterium ADurb.Bin363]|nr:MAG: GTP cyclohydrolase FolE2 [bacterium ADurb.Bin363]